MSPRELAKAQARFAPGLQPPPLDAIEAAAELELIAAGNGPEAERAARALAGVYHGHVVARIGLSGRVHVFMNVAGRSVLGILGPATPRAGGVCDADSGRSERSARRSRLVIEPGSAR
jgi:hypothetical protein